MALTPWSSHFKTDFELARRRREESIAFDALRCEAFDRFLLLGCPTQADDEWRYVDIAPVGETNFSLASKPSETASRDLAARLPFDHTAGVGLTFVNGYYVPQLSNVDRVENGLTVVPLKFLLGADDGSLFAQIARVDSLPLVALNTALFEDGACVIVSPDTAVNGPISIRFVCDGEADAKPAMTQPRALIVMGDRSAATVIESYAGAEDVEYFTNAVTEIVLGEGAGLEHHRIQRESAAAYHIAAAHVIAAPRSTYSSKCINAGGALSRAETMITLAGDAAECSVHATNVAGRNTRLNVHTTIDHAASNGVSRQRYRWRLTGDATGVLSGRTMVRPDARNVRVRLANRAQLLSSEARMVVRPTLDLLGKDVDFCSKIRASPFELRPSNVLRGGGTQWPSG
jgi:Fe-S cluster assembly protein SufD